MRWPKWYFTRDEKYLLSEVIGACDARIREGGVIRKERKDEMVREMEKLSLASIVWCPKADQGWGASPFNKNCWRTVEGAPIIPGTEASQKRRSGTSRDHGKTRVSSEHDR